MKKLTVVFVILFFNCKSDSKIEEIDSIVIGNTFQNDKKFQFGRALFLTNCASCHSTQMDKVMTAPALGGITTRRNKEWLYEYTRNSSKMFKEGDSIALQLRDLGMGLMTSFPNLTDEDLENIFYFVEKKYEIGNDRISID